MVKNSTQEEFPRLTVYLPPDMEKAVYNDFMALAKYAVEEATRNVTVNTRYLNQQQLCEYFRCGIEVIREWEKQGLKYFMKGREKFFDMKDVDDFLETQKH